MTFERCDDEPGRTVPVINRNRCEGKSDCVEVCPYDVFELRVVTPQQRTELSWFARLKLVVHGGKQATVDAPDACHACGLCVRACPERAITLVAAGART